MPPKQKKCWRTSNAKRLLVQDMMDGLVPVAERILSYKKLYEEFYADAPEFQEWPYDHRFSARVRTLQNSVNLLGAAARDDATALAHDRLVHPEPGTHAENGLLLWANSEADCWLRVDINAEKHLEMTNEDLFASRQCYYPIGFLRFT